MTDPFDKYVADFGEKRRAAESALEVTALPALERFAMKAAYLFDSGEVSFPDDDVGTVLGAVMAKLTNEVLGFSGALRMGALQGAWHHMRALMELQATLHYLFADPVETPRRIKQFVEFGSMAPWSRRRRLEFERDEGRLSAEEFKQKNLVSDALIAHATPQKIDEWKALFGATTEKNLAKRRSWHDGSIASLFSALDPSGDLHFQYEVLCHPTHVSPLGHRLSGFGPPRLFGYAPQSAKSAVEGMFGHAYGVLKIIDEQVQGALNERLAEEVTSFLALRRGAPNQSP